MKKTSDGGEKESEIKREEKNNVCYLFCLFWLKRNNQRVLLS